MDERRIRDLKQYPIGEGCAAGSGVDQLRRYLADERLARRYPSVRFTGPALVFRGWELACCEAVPCGRRPGRVAEWIAIVETGVRGAPEDFATEPLTETAGVEAAPEAASGAEERT